MKENEYRLIDDTVANPSQKMLRLTNELNWLYKINIFHNKSPPTNIEF
jgi:hypothetical protein